MEIIRSDRRPRAFQHALLWTMCVMLACVRQNAMGGTYGPGLSADALSNTRIGGPWSFIASYGFRATHSGTLAAIQPYVIWSASNSGYNGGTGGSLLFRIQTDDGTTDHHPSGQTLASYLHTDPMSKSNFPVLTFATPPQLMAGELYHIVITNPDPDPVTNFVSVNSLWKRNGDTPRQPAFADEDWFQLLAFSTQADSWRPVENGGSDSYTPILELHYADGYSTGNGYMEVWTESTKQIVGSSSVRETFTVSGADRRVTSVALRVRRVSGTAPLTVRLERNNGTLVESGTIAGIGTEYVWVTYTFSALRTLTKGGRYNLTLQSPAGTTYETFPLREGSSSNVQFSASSYFADGYAQFTTNGTWTGWDQWGGTNRLDADLQFVFATADEVPGVPDPDEPGAGSVTSSPSVRLTWHPSSGATSYRLQVSRDSLFAATAMDTSVTDTSAQFAPPVLGATYYFRVRANGGSGSSEYSTVVSFYVAVPKSESVEMVPGDGGPLSVVNYPNPFNPSTTIQYHLDVAADVSIEVYDVLGSMVARLVDARQSAGSYRVQWDARGKAAGRYFCVLRAGAAHVTSGLNLVR